MPHGLEYVIRPYQSPASHGAIIIPATPAATRERATLTWGAKATMPPVQITGGGVNVKCCDEGLTEQTRETETVRITQPGRPENYIDVARANKVILKKEEKDKCAGDWSQMSHVAQQIDAAFASLASQMDFDVPSDKNCQATWNLKNNTTAA